MKIECKCGGKRGKEHIRVGIITGTNHVIECKRCHKKEIKKTY